MNKTTIILLALPLLLVSSCEDRLETRIKPAPEANKKPSWYHSPPASFTTPENDAARGELLDSWQRLNLPERPLTSAELLALFSTISPDLRFYSKEIARLDRESLEKTDPDPALYLCFAEMVLKVHEERNGFSADKDKLFAFWCACGGFQSKENNAVSLMHSRLDILDND